MTAGVSFFFLRARAPIECKQRASSSSDSSLSSSSRAHSLITSTALMGTQMECLGRSVFHRAAKISAGWCLCACAFVGGNTLQENLRSVSRRPDTSPSVSLPRARVCARAHSQNNHSPPNTRRHLLRRTLTVSRGCPNAAVSPQQGRTMWSCENIEKFQ